MHIDLTRYQVPRNKRRVAPWSFAIDQVIKMHGTAKYNTRGYWMRKLKGKEPMDILAIIQRCEKEGNPPAKLFNYLIK